MDDQYMNMFEAVVRTLAAIDEALAGKEPEQTTIVLECTTNLSKEWEGALWLRGLRDDPKFVIVSKGLNDQKLLSLNRKLAKVVRPKEPKRPLLSDELRARDGAKNLRNTPTRQKRATDGKACNDAIVVYHFPRLH